MLGTFSEQIKSTVEERAMNITVYCGSNFRRQPPFRRSRPQLGRLDRPRRAHARVWRQLGRTYGSRVARGIEGGAPVIGVEPAFFIELGLAQHDLTSFSSATPWASARRR